MVILGIDPGLATTGYGVIEKLTSENLQALDWGIIETKKTDGFSRRLATIARDLNRLIKRRRPDVAVVESLYFAKNQKTALDVAQARGVILVTLEQKKIRLAELTPLQVKSRITGYGSASKQQVQAMVKRLLKLNSSPRPDDAADALALAICGATKSIL